MSAQDKHDLSFRMQEFLKSTPLNKGLQKVRAEAVWAEQMGPGINNYTREVWWQDYCLHVRLDSAPLKQELLMGKSKIIKILNERLGDALIQELKFL